MAFPHLKASDEYQIMVAVSEILALEYISFPKSIVVEGRHVGTRGPAGGKRELNQSLFTKATVTASIHNTP
jgi:hypothetical protein